MVKDMEVANNCDVAVAPLTVKQANISQMAPIEASRFKIIGTTTSHPASTTSHQRRNIQGFLSSSVKPNNNFYTSIIAQRLKTSM